MADAQLLDSSMETGGGAAMNSSTAADPGLAGARSIQQGSRPLLVSNALAGAENRLVAIAEVLFVDWFWLP
jgi:hypothetical protein